MRRVARLLVAPAFEPGHLVAQLRIQLALAEQPGPVLVRRRRGSGADHIQDVLGWVRVLTALDPAPLLKVANQRRRVRAQVAEVHRLTALLQQQEAVELVEELTARLVDRAEDCLALRRELLEELDDRPGRLCVEAGRGLVKEQKQTRLRGQLHTNRETLALLHIETLANLTDERLGERLHLKELNNRLDIVETLLLRSLTRLAQQGRELQRLAHRLLRQVHVLLLAVARVRLERPGQRTTVHEKVSRYDADVGTLGQHVEQRRLAGTTLAH